MKEPRIGIVVGTTRQGRFSERAAEWIRGLAVLRGGAQYELVELREYPLPLFDEPIPPRFAPPRNDMAVRLSRRIAALDALIIVTAEYNHGVPAVLKNALDYGVNEYQRKPAAFVSYGGVGGARSVEHLRQIVNTLQMAPVPAAVHIGLPEFMGLLQQGKDFVDYPHLGQAATAMLEDLQWWTRALTAAREVA